MDLEQEYLKYLDVKNQDRSHNLTVNGYEVSERTALENIAYYGKDFAKGLPIGVAKMTEGASTLGAAVLEKYILGPKTMEMIDPEGDGIVKEVGEFYKNKVYPTITEYVGETETMAGGFGEGIGQFLIPGAGYYKLFNTVIKAKGVIPFFIRAFSAESAAVGTAQVAGEGNLTGSIAPMFAEIFDINLKEAEGMAARYFNYLATPEDVTDGVDADDVLAEKWKAIQGDAPVAPAFEALGPFFLMFGNQMKRLFKKNPKGMTKNLSMGAAMNPDGDLAKSIEDGTYRTYFEVPDNPYKTPKEPLSLAMTKEDLIAGAKVAESGKDWYVRHKPILKELFGEDADFFEELIGITSQQASVDENIERAMIAYKYFKEKGSFKDLEFSDNNELSLLKGVVGNLKRLDGSMESATGKLAGDKQIRERMGEGPTKTSTGVETYFAGNKVPDFVEAMKEGTDEVVTMDRHMIQIIFGKKAQVSKYNMAEGKKIVTEIANELNWTPKETQAAIWAFNQIRDHDITKAKTKGLNDVRDYEKALTDRAEKIELLVSEFSNPGGSSKSIQTGSSTSKETVGKKKRYIVKEDLDLDTEDLYGISADEIDAGNTDYQIKGKSRNNYTVPLNQQDLTLLSVEPKGDIMHDMYKEQQKIVVSVANNPEKQITVYRVVPKNVKNAKINNGDFVALTKKLAGAFGEPQTEQMISMKVKAKDIYTQPNNKTGASFIYKGGTK